MRCNTAVNMYKNALLAGAVVGGTLALLYAPKTGEETRGLLASKTEFVRRMTGHSEGQSSELDDDDARARRLEALHVKTVKEERMHNRILAYGFITGAIIGGTVGLLYAPKSGKDTREFLKTKADYTTEEARTLAAHAKAFAIEEARKVKAATIAAKHEAEGLRS